MRKLTKLITNNFGLKILALIFAAILWLVVINIEDPDNTKVFTIPVTVTNQEFLTDMSKTYEIVGNDEISFTVTGKRSVLEELSESDFSAIADLSNIDTSMSLVPITLTASRYKSQIEITKKSSFLSVLVEDLLTQNYDITVVTEGELEENCVISDTALSLNKVSVTGPESVMETISGAQVRVNIDGMDEDIVTVSDIYLVDENGDDVSQERLELNRTTVDVDLAVLMRKTIPLEYETVGEPGENYRFDGISGDVEYVVLEGAADKMKELRMLILESEELDLSDKTADYEFSLPIGEYLPAGVSLAEGEPETVTISVKISAQSKRYFDVPTANITVENLDGDLNLKFEDDTFTVSLIGYADELDDIQASDIKGVLDASDFTTDVTSAEVAIDGDYNLASQPSVRVLVTDISDDSASDDDTADELTE